MSPSVPRTSVRSRHPASTSATGRPRLRRPAPQHGPPHGHDHTDPTCLKSSDNHRKSKTLVEIGPTEEVVGSPRDDYTRSLLEAIPRLGRT